MMISPYIIIEPHEAVLDETGKEIARELMKAQTEQMEAMKR
jgi:hypothetical protein